MLDFAPNGNPLFVNLASRASQLSPLWAARALEPQGTSVPDTGTPRCSNANRADPRRVACLCVSSSRDVPTPQGTGMRCALGAIQLLLLLLAAGSVG